MHNKQEVVSRAKYDELQIKAEEHDTRLTHALEKLNNGIIEVGCELAIIRDQHLYRFLRDPKTNGDNRGCFGNWRDYARHKLGTMSTAKMYELISAHTLTCGENAIPTCEVVELGVKKAVQLSRLPKKNLTTKMVEEAKRETVKELTVKINKMLDEEKPEAERKEKLVALNVGLPQTTMDLINEVERDGMFLEEIRDGDKTLSLRAKLWHAVWWEFFDTHREELKEAARYRENYIAQQKTQDSKDVVAI